MMIELRVPKPNLVFTPYIRNTSERRLPGLAEAVEETLFAIDHAANSDWKFLDANGSMALLEFSARNTMEQIRQLRNALEHAVLYIQTDREKLQAAEKAFHPDFLTKEFRETLTAARETEEVILKALEATTETDAGDFECPACHNTGTNDIGTACLTCRAHDGVIVEHDLILF